MPKGQEVGYVRVSSLLQNTARQLDGVQLDKVFEDRSSLKDTPMANLLLSMLGAVAEFERALILELQREGIAVAKAQGVYKGRKPSLSPGRADALRARAAAGESKSNLARELGISRETVNANLRASLNAPQVTR